MRLLLLASILMVVAPAAFAGQIVNKPDALPGVSLDYRIVKPAPEPLADAKPVVDEEGFTLIGNTRVKVSGLVRVDLDFDTREDRRRD